jgi:7-carboxy-7-deazaguanine synthase
MIINEIFYSIQGEGKWMGLPSIFIRTTGCNLRCSYCDTKYSYKEGKKISQNKIFDTIKVFPCKHICITGGEPLLQKETIELIEKIINKDYFVCIETNGSINIKNIIKFKSLLISLDIKCPSSNMVNKMILENIHLLRENDQLKFIIKNRKDYEYAKRITDEFKPKCIVFFQNVWGCEYSKLAEWILKDGLNVKLGIQLHKIIWSDKKGL